MIICHNEILFIPIKIFGGNQKICMYVCMITIATKKYYVLGTYMFHSCFQTPIPMFDQIGNGYRNRSTSSLSAMDKNFRIVFQMGVDIITQRVQVLAEGLRGSIHYPHSIAKR